MITDHDRICPGSDGQLRVFYIQDTFENQLATPFFFDPCHVIPVQGWVKLTGGPLAQRQNTVATLTWPTKLPNVLRPVNARNAQAGFVARSMILASVNFGGTDMPFFKSLWRCPKICKSSVSTNAEHLAVLAR